MGLTAKICKRAALITCVSNAGGMGPGHSAVVVDDNVFTFERVAGAWLVPNGSGWLQIKTVDYFGINTHRPLVVQELDPGQTDARLIYEYIETSTEEDADYLGSGVCSQQAASAIGAGLRLNLDGWGPNIPYAVYKILKSTGRVSASYYTFPSQDTSGDRVAKTLAMAQLRMWYTPECTRRTEPPAVTSW